ncbi:16S rRNA (adenine(1518)-N(6)/adenine(1519)-N(6))-dimethyltransferase RsmA [Candidatus Parcubacteria bacterium]|nr:16S rRNA (adenine(1518)-N(6)/adenine(1519)-N(6))-dimethyltransferase RsmA [Candidatus Parcubacteria bacterium]
MDLTDPGNLRLALRLAGITPRKGLGQHFLVDRPSLEMIVGAADLSDQDTVLEIGPGLGVLTNRLTDRAGRVVAVEADRVLEQLLRRDAPSHLEVISGDILDFNLSALGPGYKVVANLPYYLSAKILRLLMEGSPPPALAVLLVQREVAERVTAAPGNLSVLALSVQYYAEADVVGQVERHKFWPAPEVDSAVLRIRRRPAPAFAADPQLLFRLVKAGFGERRKQLKNSLAGGLNCSVDVSSDLLRRARISPAARAQELGLPQWERLYRQALKRGVLT